MTQIINDNVQVEMTIDGDEWLVVDAETKLSFQSQANYTKIRKMTPHPDTTFGKVEELIDTEFELKVQNDIDDRPGGEELKTLFKGKLANISPRGAKDYEGIAYDPSQQAFGTGQGANMQNLEIQIGYPYYSPLRLFSATEGLSGKDKTLRADKVANKIANKIPNLNGKDIRLKQGGTEKTGPSGSTIGGFNPKLTFDKQNPKIGKALAKIREECLAEWWFDEEGVFNVGVPESVAYELRYITDTSAGITTPPYSSVKVIGSGVVSEEGFNRTDMRSEERIVVQGAISKTGKPVIGKSTSTQFTYRNAELSTQKQAKDTAKRLLKDLKEQQKDGEITLVGFPEISPLDALIMPHDNEDSDAPNYQPGMPMGGERYGAHKVKHRLNNSDGYKTIVEVGAPIGVTRVNMPAKEKPKSKENETQSAGYSGGQGPMSAPARIN